jgi:ABC-2 type transport system ATP-binding protein
MLIEARELTKDYGAIHALGPLSISLPPGPLGLLGPNGAGKSTFLRLLLGLLPPTGGSASVLGLDADRQGLEIRERVGYMPEHECLIPEMTGVGFVAYMGRLSGLPPAVAISRAHDVLEFVGMGEERFRHISSYSFGMRQRVKLAQAIVHDPELCLLDEPTAGLDPRGREEMIGLLKVLARKEGRSLVLSTHILSDVEGICENVIVLDRGQALAQGRLQDLLSVGADQLVVIVKGEPSRFLAGLADRKIPYQVVGNELRVKRPSGGERELFQVALETHTQIRHLGRASRTVEDFFLDIIQNARKGGVP